MYPRVYETRNREKEKKKDGFSITFLIQMETPHLLHMTGVKRTYIGIRIGRCVVTSTAVGGNGEEALGACERGRGRESREPLKAGRIYPNNSEIGR